MTIKMNMTSSEWETKKRYDGHGKSTAGITAYLTVK
jgi:hypothetical protein